MESQLVTASPDHPKNLLNTPGMTFRKTNTTQGLRAFLVAPEERCFDSQLMDPSLEHWKTWTFLEISGNIEMEIGHVGMKSSSVPLNPIHTVIYLQVVGTKSWCVKWIFPVEAGPGSHSHLFGVVLFQAALEDLLSVHSSDPRKRGRVHLLPGRTTENGQKLGPL